jgi:hypothetical protein
LAFGTAAFAALNDESTLAGVSARVGIILMAVWIAFPRLAEAGSRSYLGAALAGLILLWRPRSAVVLLPLLAFALARRPVPESS